MTTSYDDKMFSDLVKARCQMTYDRLLNEGAVLPKFVEFMSGVLGYGADYELDGHIYKAKYQIHLSFSLAGNVGGKEYNESHPDGLVIGNISHTRIEKISENHPKMVSARDTFGPSTETCKIDGNSISPYIDENGCIRFLMNKNFSENAE